MKVIPETFCVHMISTFLLLDTFTIEIDSSYIV